MDGKKIHRVRPCGGMDCEARGFTLIELLAVISIIALLAALGSLGYRLASHDAKSAAALADMETLRLALEEHRVERGRYPEVWTAALGFLTNAVEGVELTDPWGQPYHYRVEGPYAYRLWSTGSDLQDAADDVIAGGTGT